MMSTVPCWVSLLIWKCGSRYLELCQRLGLQDSWEQMFPRCYSLPVWLLHVQLFMYLFVLAYKQNKKDFYNPIPLRLRVQDII